MVDMTTEIQGRHTISDINRQEVRQDTRHEWFRHKQQIVKFQNIAKPFEVIYLI
jgi:hypothetical protein